MGKGGFELVGRLEEGRKDGVSMTELQVTNGQMLTKGQHTSSYKFTCQDCIWFLGSESELVAVDRINMVPAASVVVL